MFKSIFRQNSAYIKEVPVNCLCAEGYGLLSCMIGLGFKPEPQQISAHKEMCRIIPLDIGDNTPQIIPSKSIRSCNLDNTVFLCTPGHTIDTTNHPNINYFCGIKREFILNSPLKISEKHIKSIFKNKKYHQHLAEMYYDGDLYKFAALLDKIMPEDVLQSDDFYTMQINYITANYTPNEIQQSLDGPSSSKQSIASLSVAGTIEFIPKAHSLEKLSTHLKNRLRTLERLQKRTQNWAL